MLNRSDLGAHHTITVCGKTLPFPALVKDNDGHEMRVDQLGYMRHHKIPSLAMFRVVWGISWPKEMSFQSACQMTDPNLMGLEDGAATLMSVFRQMGRKTFEDYRRLMKPLGHPKWLRRMRNHARRGRCK